MKRLIIDFAQKYGCTNHILKLFFLYRNYLKTTGWLKSVKRISSIDANGNPIPWFTYPAIHFLEGRMNKTLTVFEYGSGNSTIWFSDRVGKIVSLENDQTWFNLIQKDLTKRSNVEYIFDSDVAGGSYAKAIQKTNQKYDIIIIDGKDRNNCCYNSIDFLTERGVILFDNTDYHEWFPSIDFIMQKGFKRIDFWGIPPLAHFDGSTTIFYKQNNCLGI